MAVTTLVSRANRLTRGTTTQRVKPGCTGASTMPCTAGLLDCEMEYRTGTAGTVPTKNSATVRIIPQHLSCRRSGSCVLSRRGGHCLALGYVRGNNHMSTIAPPSQLTDTGDHRLDDLLTGFSTDVFRGEGVHIKTLDPGASLTVRTCQSEYRLTVLDGERREVLVRGGLWFPEAERAYLEGSTAGGSALKMGWLGVGLRMELSTGHGRITTSRVQSIRRSCPGAPAPSVQR